MSLNTKTTLVTSDNFQKINGRRLISTITSTETKEGTGWLSKKATYYTIVSATIGSVDKIERGNVQRRYKEFWSFYTAMSTKYGDIIPSFLVNRNKFTEDHFTDAFINARKLLLSDWLNKTLNINDTIQNDDLVCEFLGLRASTAYDESLPGFSACASYGDTTTGISKLFSTTNEEKIKMTEEDRQYLPDEVMTVYRITDDDL
jgi:hypothetical protein